MNAREKDILAVVNCLKSAKYDLGQIRYKTNNIEDRLKEAQKKFKNILSEEDMSEEEEEEDVVMEEDFVFSYRINGEVIRDIVLDKKMKSLLMNGLNYAMTKDSISERQKEYRLLMTGLNKVINGERRIRKRL